MSSFPLLISACLAICWLPISWLLLRRARQVNAAQREQAAAQQTRLQLELFRIGRSDGLTGLACRGAFLETVSAAFAHGRRFAVLLIDLDEFAAVNASFGDTIGDDVLRVFADRLRALSGKRDHAARLDGDAFALLIDASDDLDKLAATAGRVLCELTSPCPAGGQLIEIGASMGVALAPAHGESAEPLLRAARLAQHQAAHAGGDRWQLCDRDLITLATSRHHARQELTRAIGTGQIIPWYQPIVRLPSGEVAGFEVLARWHHPSKGVLTPDQFIPLADELGLSGHISMALLRQVAVDCRDWPEQCRFAFNVSAGQVRELIGLLSAQPGEWQRRMDFSRLDVEITEAALMHDRAMARELIDTLHEHGARAGLDNFGAGNSNFAFLRDMPFDIIKIGKPFVQGMMEDARAEACVRAMLSLGQGLGVEMVAAGVETAAVAERLAAMGCPLAQGYLYARPVPACDVALGRRDPLLLSEKQGAFF